MVLCSWKYFSEGIDLTGESLIGVVIVGTGLPQICNEREVIREYFDRRQKRDMIMRIGIRE